MYIDETLGERIRRLKITRGLSQVELGERTDLSESAISMIERGLRGVSMQTLTRLAEVLGVNTGWLLSRIQGP